MPSPLVAEPASFASGLAWALAPLVAVSGFWLPGRLALLGRGAPLPVVTEILGSLLLLFFSVLACDLLRLPLAFPALPLCVALGVMLLRAFRSRAVASAPVAPPRDRPIFPPPRNWLRELWWLLPCALAFGSVLWRGVVDPVAGVDNGGRWNYLALAMHDTASLSFYPPVSPSDFQLYFWCDGIPPLVPILNLWLYLGTGSTHGGLIVFRLLLELGVTVALVWHLAGNAFGPLGARLATLALAASALLLGSVSIAQETGLAGVGLLALAGFLLAYRAEPSRAAAAWIGVAAGFCAMCRDYNLAYLPVALLLFAFLRPPARHLLLSLAAISLVAAPWYARNLLHTGNPLFAHDLPFLAGGNAYHSFLMESFRQSFHFGRHFASEVWFQNLLSLAVGAGLVVLCALLALAGPARGLRFLAWLPLTTAGLWLVSVSSTAGGLLYSYRVLGPALPILAVLAGALARWPRPARLACAGLLAVSALDASQRHWTYLDYFAGTPRLASPGAAALRQSALLDYRRTTLWDALGPAAGGAVILADQPIFGVYGASRGIRITTFSSPLARPITLAVADTPRQEIIRGLRAAGVRFVVLIEENEGARAFNRRHPGISRLMEKPPVGWHRGLAIYDLAKEEA